MGEHRFQVGDHVRLQSSRSLQPGEVFLDEITRTPVRGEFEIVRLLPASETGEPQYRIKGTSDEPERVVRESQLVRVVRRQPRR